jgi:hypothetical protein
MVLWPRTQDAAGALSPQLIHRPGIYGRLADTSQIENGGGDPYQLSGVRVDELM